MGIKAGSLVVLALLTLSGCSANYHSIYRHKPLEKDPSLTLVDAKQRAILAAKYKNASNEEFTRFCAEPSPDVFAVIAQSLSGGATFGRGADPAAIQAALNAAFSTSEQGSTIPRTQTTNTLREVMFRTCERYLSGGISDVELSIQAVRDQRLIVSILAIESLTGAYVSKAIAVGASANASGGASGADAAIRLDDQNKLVVKKADAVAKKQTAFDTLNGAAKDCDTIAKAVADKKEDDLSQALKDKRPKCEAASGDLDTAKKDKADADAHYKALLATAGAGGIPVSAGGTVMTPVALGGPDGGGPSDMSQVATAVKEIVAGTFNQDEYLFVCLKVLQNTESKLTEVVKNCTDYIKSQVDRERARNETATAGFVAAKAEIDERFAPLFDNFWKLVSTDDRIDAAKLASVKKNIRTKDWPGCFNGASTKADYHRCFNGTSVVAGVRRDLAKGKSND